MGQKCIQVITTSSVQFIKRHITGYLNIKKRVQNCTFRETENKTLSFCNRTGSKWRNNIKYKEPFKGCDESSMTVCPWGAYGCRYQTRAMVAIFHNCSFQLKRNNYITEILHSPQFQCHLQEDFPLYQQTQITKFAMITSCQFMEYCAFNVIGVLRPIGMEGGGVTAVWDNIFQVASLLCN